MKKTYALAILLLCCINVALSAQKSAEEYYKAYAQLKSENKEIEALVPLRNAADLGHAEAQYQVGNFYYYNQSDTKEAFTWFTKSAEQGHANAQFELGLMYSSGEGTERNEEKAILWYSKAAAQGGLDAAFNLTLIYSNVQDWPNAFKYGKLAAEQGLDKAQVMLSNMYFYGLGVEADSIQGITWLKKAAEQDLDDAQAYLGYYYFYGHHVKQDYNEAIAWLNKAVLNNSGMAQCLLGRAFEYGNGVPSNIHTAISWYTKSICTGFEPAEECMGFLLLEADTLGLSNDEKKEGLALLTKMARNNHPCASFFIGAFRLKGILSEVNTEDGLRLISKSAEDGYTLAQFTLAACYKISEYVERDTTTSRQWLNITERKAKGIYIEAFTRFFSKKNFNYLLRVLNSPTSELLSYIAPYKKARIFRYGEDGIEKNLTESMMYYEIAASQGDKNAQYELGAIYETGEGEIVKDYTKAFKYYTLAAEQGFDEAQYHLGWLYENGLGCTKNINQAKAWYRKANRIYHGAALERLIELQKSGL